MNKFEIRISRADVYEEVAKTADYTGSKLTEGGDADIRDRLLITDEDFQTLGRLWEESVAAANERLRGLYVGGSAPSEGEYRAELRVPSNFDSALSVSIRNAVRSYLILSVTGKWFVLAGSDLAEGYMASAVAMMQGALRMLYSRKAPEAPRNKVQITSKPQG